MWKELGLEYMERSPGHVHRSFRQGQLEVVKLTMVRTGSEVPSHPVRWPSSQGSVGEVGISAQLWLRACLDGNSGEGSGCQQRGAESAPGLA